MRLPLALLAAVVAASFPASAIADDTAAPPSGAGDTAAPACLAQAGGEATDQALRGVQVGVRAKLRDADGKPLAVNSVSYCVEGGGDFSLALSREQDIVLVVSTSDGDSIGPINPSSPSQSARLQFPKMKKLARTGETAIYRVDPKRQLILGVAAGRVNFVAAADRLLLEYPNKLGYYMRRLGF